jgi:putative MATE family efflux protein
MGMKRERKIENRLITGNISRSIWTLAAPMMIGGALEDLFSMVDLYFVGRLGHIEVAALAIAGTVVAILMMMVQGITVGTTALIAHFTGDRNYEEADQVLGQTFVLGLIGSFLMYIIAVFLVEPILILFGAKGEVLIYAADYLKITFGWSIAIFFFEGVNQALRGSGDAQTPLKALIIANILNIILDPLLIMGYGPFPQMGVAGAAIATALTRGIGFIFLFLHLTMGHSTLQFKVRYTKLNLFLMKRIISIGSFSSLQVFIREVSFLFLMRLVASFGAVTLAAYGIGARLRMVIMVPGLGFANSASVLVGQNMGAKQPERATESAWRTVLYYEFIAIPLATIFIIFAPQLVAIFAKQPEVIRIGTSFLRYLGVTFPFLALSLVLGQAMNGAGDTAAPTIINAIAQLGVRIPLAYIFALVVGMGSSGIWLGINASDIAQGLGMVFLFKSGHWKKVYAKHREKLEQQPIRATRKVEIPSS